MSKAMSAVAALVLLIAACGDDAPSISPGTGVIDSFDGVTAIETIYPGDAELAIGDEGAGHFVAVSMARAVIYLAQYPPQFTLFDGDITMRFREGEVAPTAVIVTFWKSTDFSRYAQASLSLDRGNAFIGWYDEAADYQEVEFEVPEGLYDPADLNTLVIGLHGDTAALTLNDIELGEVVVGLPNHDGELAWGMLPNLDGSELIVDDFTAIPPTP